MQKTKLLGKGNTAEVWEYETGKVCKLFFEGYPHEYIRLEFENAKEMYKNKYKINIPKPFQIVTIGKRQGIVYEKIEGKTLLNIIMTERKETLDERLNMFAALHLDILTLHSRNVLSYKEYLIAMLKGKKATDQMIFYKIMTAPDDDCLLHGDFHPGNILVTPDGTPAVIDFMNVCRGPALYDIARTYFLVKQYDKYWAKQYLNRIRTDENDIVEYLNIIDICRKYEN